MTASTRICKREGCGRPFHPSAWGLKKYCSDACQREDFRRICQNPMCGREFFKKSTADSGRFCSNDCMKVALHAGRVARMKMETAKRVAKGRIKVECGLGPLCLHPGVLIAQPLSKCSVDANGRDTREKLHYHVPDCEEVWRKSGGGRKGTGRAVSAPEQPPASPITGPATRACPVCSKTTSIDARRAARTKNTFCSQAHHLEWFHTRGAARRQEVRCTTCGETRSYPMSRVPRAVDRVTMTWVCPSCAARRTGVRTQVCAYVECGKTFTARVRLSPPSKEHFCCADHRTRHYLGRKRARRCARCGGRLQRNGRNVLYCGWSCYTAAKKGAPLPRHQSSQAERRILEQWTEGVRGVRALARESGASVNTVRKLIAAGKMVEPAAARSA